jgi:hypothetical protein
MYWLRSDWALAQTPRLWSTARCKALSRQTDHYSDELMSMQKNFVLRFGLNKVNKPDHASDIK